MRCPVCKSTRLVHARYDDVPVRTCPDCKGFLVTTLRVDKIKTAHRDSKNEENDDPTNRYALDTTRNILCTTCGQSMKKKLMANGKDRYHIDECQKCELVWFDQHELKKLQSQFLIAEERKEMLAKQVYFIYSCDKKHFSDDNGNHLYTKTTFYTSANYPCPHCEKPISSTRENTHISTQKLSIVYEGYSDVCRHCGRMHTVPHEPFDERLFHK